ncbi:hypothetical protein [Sphingomonas sp.]|uniref:hypothetical protein n=1 Tax=Sphingomonas sp. TaxID=28214 RepID=UPI0035BBFA52
MLTVAAGKARRYLADMAGSRRRSDDGVDTRLLTSFLDARPQAGATQVPKAKAPRPTHEQRLVAKVGQANRREGVRSLKGLTDQEILDRIAG